MRTPKDLKTPSAPTLETQNQTPEQPETAQAPEQNELLGRILDDLKLNGPSGAALAAIAGVEKDLQFAALGKIAVLDVIVHTDDVNHTRTELTAMAVAENGVLASTSHSAPGTFRAQFAFPNGRSAKNIRTLAQTLDPQAKSTIAYNEAHVGTLDGQVLTYGPAFEQAKEGNNQNGRAHKVIIDGQMRPEEHLETQAGTSNVFVPRQSTKSLGQAQNLTTRRETVGEISSNVEVVCIKSPYSFQKSPHLISGFITRLKNKLPGTNLVQLNGNVITIISWGERGTGHKLEQAGRYKNSALNTHGICITLDTVEGVHPVHLSNGEIVLQGDFNKNTPSQTATGLWESTRFTRTYEGDKRNASVATRELGTELNGFTEVRSVAPQHSEIAVPEDEKTIGRATELEQAREILESVASGKAKGGVILVRSEAGGGKTHFAKDLKLIAESLGFKTRYERASEQATTLPYDYVNKLGTLLVDALPLSQTHDFRALEAVRDGVPNEKLPEEIQKEVATMRASTKYFAEKLFDIFAAAGGNDNFLLQVDDLHWMDTKSAEVITELFNLAGENDAGSNVIAVLSRLEEKRDVKTSEGKQHVQIGIPSDTMTAINSHYNHQVIDLNRLENSPDEVDITSEFILSKLERDIQPAITLSELPTIFAQVVFDHFQNHPHQTEQFLKVLVEQGEIKRDESGTPIFPNESRTKELAISLRNTVDLVQARISKLPAEMVNTFDLLVEIGEPVSYESLKAINAENGIEDTRGLLHDLISSKLVIRSKGPYGQEVYAPIDELIHNARLAQIKKDPATQSRRAKKLVDILQQNPRVAATLSPTADFNLRHLALRRPDITDSELVEEISALFNAGKAATRAELALNNNDSAANIAERSLALMQEVPASVAQKYANQLQKIRAELLALSAEAESRIGKPVNAQQHLTEYENIAESLGSHLVPQLELAPLKAELAFLTTYNYQRVEEVASEIEAIHTVLTAKAKTRPELQSKLEAPLVVAEGAVMLSKLRSIGLRSRSAELKERAMIDLQTIVTEFQAVAEKLEAQGSPNARKMASLVRRQYELSAYQALVENVQGVSEEALHLQTFTPEQAAIINKLYAGVAKTTDMWISNPELIAQQPQYVAFNFVLAARLSRMAGNTEISDRYIDEGIRMSRRLRTSWPLAALTNEAGDVRIAKNLKTCATRLDQWNPAELQEAIDSYDATIRDLTHIGGMETLYGTTAIVNKSIALAGLTMSQLENMGDEEKAQRADEIRAHWKQMNFALRVLAKNLDPDKAPESSSNQEYLKELCSLGLLASAAHFVGLTARDLEIEEASAVNPENIAKQKAALETQRNRPNTTNADQKLIGLRQLGIKQLERFLTT